MPNVTLCADTASVTHPEMLGLDGERPESQGWLRIVTDGARAREQVQSEDGAHEVWVAGSDDVDAINLAATLKRDCQEGHICLLAPERSGSLYSRAQAAGIDEVFDQPTFASRYLAYKHKSQTDSPVVSTPSQATGVRVVEVSKDAPPVAEQPARFKPEIHVPAKQTASKGFLLAVVGAGGGVGKSSVAVMAACASQHAGHSTVIVDADLQFGDIRYLMGSNDALTLDQAVAAPGRLDTLEPQGALPAIVAAPSHVEQSEVVFDQLDAIVDRLLQRFAVVVVNTSSWYNDAQIKVIEKASNVLFIVGQRPSSVRACRHALALCARCGVAAQPFLFALNRCSRHALFSSIDVSCALQGVHVDELQDGGREVEELLGAGQPLDLLNSKNAFASSVAGLVDDILPKAAASKPVGTPPATRRRSRFSARRKKAACL